MPASDVSRVYFDCAATAPFDERLREVMLEASWANANALYEEGKEAATQLRDARKRIANVLHAHAPSEIIFTSGGTESDNMGIVGLAQLSQAPHGHIVVAAIEHHAALRSAESLKAQGYKIDYLQPDRNGVCEPSALEELLQKIEAQGDACVLACVQWVNNEIGTIQPVSELASIAHAHGAKFFCDGVQALGKLPIDLEGSGVDACAFSAHKIGAPKGFGILYLHRSCRIRPLLFGGGQEAGMRSGTSNVPAACAFARAVALAEEARESMWNKALELRSRLLDGIAGQSYAHGIQPTLQDLDASVPHIVSLFVEGLEGETMVLRADNAGFAISSGSACSSASLEPSHVLGALGLSRDQALGGVRLSFCKENTEEEVDRFLAALPEILR